MPGLIPRVSMDEARGPGVIMYAFVRKFRLRRGARRVQDEVEGAMLGPDTHLISVTRERRGTVCL